MKLSTNNTKTKTFLKDVNMLPSKVSNTVHFATLSPRHGGSFGCQ